MRKVTVTFSSVPETGISNRDFKLANDASKLEVKLASDSVQ
jgi:pterin-4a-carbinolamine dehydratase